MIYTFKQIITSIIPIVTCGSDVRKYGSLAKSLVDIPSHHISPEEDGKTANDGGDDGYYEAL